MGGTEKYRFDLTWLEPHVQAALGAKTFMEKAMEVEKLKENVVALELETERLKAKMVAAMVEGRDLNTELGCGSWMK